MHSMRWYIRRCVSFVVNKPRKSWQMFIKPQGELVDQTSDCPNWKALGICSHCVAVAQSNSCLQEYINFFRKSKHLPSITQLLLTGLPGGVGNKGNRVSRKRKREEIQDRVTISIHKESTTKQSPPATSSTTQTVTSYAYSTAATTSGYMYSNASSVPCDSVMQGPSGSYLPYSPVMYPHHQPHPHPMSMQFSTGIGDIRVQSPTQWSAPYWPSHHTYPSYSETEFRPCFCTGNISVCNGCRNKFDKKAKSLGPVFQSTVYTLPVGQDPK